MKIFLLLLLTFVSSGAYSQTISFKDKQLVGGTVAGIENLDQVKSLLPLYKGRNFAVLQFSKMPGEKERKLLEQAGLFLLDYVSNNAYTVVVHRTVSPQFLQDAGINALLPVPAEVKLAPVLRQEKFPAFAVKVPGKVDVLISITKALTVSETVDDLVKAGVEVLHNDWEAYHIITARVSQHKVKEIAALPFVNYVQPLPPADKKLNDDVRSNHKANLLHAPVSVGGENLQGQGVVIGIGDNADLKTHVDIADRVIDHAPFLPETHGVHVAGIAAGAGIIDPLFRGVAPKATLIAQVFGGIFKNAGAYVSEYGMVITNNSYGSISGECDYSGTYDLYSTVLDQQAFQFPELLHVFAAGNDGQANLQCPQGGYNRLLGGYQSAKNILAVAWGDKDMKVSPASSWGPAGDGRIKPEITATGSDVRSPAANNNYLTDWGSSMASPAVAGGAALLVEKFRQMNAGANPKSGLLKAVLMNGAQDIEAPGPDYKSGFGWMNLKRSVEMIKNNRFINSTIANAAINTHPINIPAGTTQLKVMLYWHDPAAAVFAQRALVNNLDLELVDPSNNTVLPWTLNRANVTAPSIRGVDSLNNVEQITISDPVSGSYIIRVKGTAININPQQEYFLVYDFVPAEILVTFPSANEPLVPGETVWINWDVWDISTNEFTIEYSTDGGSTWQVISAAVPSAARNFQWNVPNISAENALVRVKRNGTGISDVSSGFVILPQPSVTLASPQCPTYMALQWNAIANATDYEVMIKRGAQMVPVATTTNTFYTFSSLHRDSIYYASVRGRINGNAGRRAVAISRRPNDGICVGNISNNDLLLDTIIAPNNGRKLISTEIKDSTIVIRIKNLDDVAIAGFDVKYSINGGAFTTQNIAASIPPQAHYDHTVTGLNFSSAGTYTITAVVSRTADPVGANDTLTKVVKHLPNPQLSLPFAEGFETAPAIQITQPSIGLPGLDRWDFTSTSPYGRLRTAAGSVGPHSGNRAITLDTYQYTTTGNSNFLTGTFNLAQYAFSFSDELGLRFDFWYKNHGRSPHPDNRVWMRNSDTSAWIEVFNFDAQPALPGVWQKTPPFHIANYPAQFGMLSTSVQVRIGQHSNFGTADNENFEGLSIDDLTWYQAPNDFYLDSVLAPSTKNCALTSNELLTIKVVAVRGIPVPIAVAYQVNNGPIIRENAPYPNTPYTFATPMDLSAIGTHVIKVWVDVYVDDYRSNDTIIYTLRNQPLINTFPYLQDFENGAGNWYAEGHNSTWQLGTPESIKINKAASGTNAWKTSLRGSYNDNELSYLYSPCFNTAALTTPYLSFSLALDIEQCKQSVCDAAWMEYSLDGVNWMKLGAYGSGTNWYNRQGDNVWDSAAFKRWHVASIDLPKAQSLQLRFVIQSDASLIKEGIAVDDIHVYDRQFPIYRATFTNTATSVQNVVGNDFVHFTQNNQLIASINPAGNNLGTTEASAYVHITTNFNVRNINNQYYHHRNITIKPALSTLADSSVVRFYFTDAETDTLTRAIGCATCAVPKDAYELGITKYDDIDDSRENGTLADNLSGNYSFIPNHRVKIVPYDIGYYAEFKVKNFSEFWLNNGGGNNHHLLPLQLQVFSAIKKDRDVLVQWTVLNESNVSHYEVQVARGNEAYSGGRFETIGNVAARNAAASNYEWIDAEPGKASVRYYRLKIVDKDGVIRYSDVKPVLFSPKEQWLVYPNPAKDLLNIITQAEAGSKVEMQLMNSLGQVVWQQSRVASGMPDKLQVDLDKTGIAAGVYMIKIAAGEEVKFIKVVKQ